MNSERDRDPREDMSFLKRHWLYASVGLMVLFCVALGTFLVWRANQPVELKTVYALPEPNPERAEILKRALQPPKRAYATKVLNKATTTEGTTVESLDDSSGKSSSQDNDFEDEDLESALMAIDEEAAEQKSDFPPVPEGFIYPPVWIGIPGYKKGDMPEHELICRVLIKLWNEGDRQFVNGVYRQNDGKVYPLYRDVVYVRWRETTIEFGEGNPIHIRFISNQTSTRAYPFELEDFINGTWKTKYPGVTFLNYEEAGYDPTTFLTEND